MREGACVASELMSIVTEGLQHLRLPAFVRVPCVFPKEASFCSLRAVRRVCAERGGLPFQSRVHPVYSDAESTTLSMRCTSGAQAGGAFGSAPPLDVPGRESRAKERGGSNGLPQPRIIGGARASA